MSIETLMGAMGVAIAEKELERHLTTTERVCIHTALRGLIVKVELVPTRQDVHEAVRDHQEANTIADFIAQYGIMPVCRECGRTNEWHHATEADHAFKADD